MMISKKKSSFKISCTSCALRFVCFPSSVSLLDLPQLDAIIEKDQIVSVDNSIFLQNDKPIHIYAVRSGVVKSTIRIRDGIEQITNFYLTGDIIGIENVGAQTYYDSAYAVQKTSVCSISMEKLKFISKELQGLHEYLLHLAAKQLQVNQKNMLLLNQMNALERVAMFLLTLATRYKSKQLSDTQFYLPLSKADISNYLGITAETFSRTLSFLKKNKIITVKGRLIKIIDKHYLYHILDTTIK